MCNTYTNKLNFDVIKSREKRCEDLMKNMRLHDTRRNSKGKKENGGKNQQRKTLHIV